MTSQIGARNGLMPANQVEHDAAVDVAGRFARRHLKIGQIDFSQPSPPTSENPAAVETPEAKNAFVMFEARQL